MTDFNAGATVTDGGSTTAFQTPQYANDGDNSTRARVPEHLTGAGTVTAILKTDLGSPQNVGSLLLNSSFGQGSAAEDPGWTVEYASSGSGPWTAVTGFSSSWAGYATALTTLTFDAATARWWRIRASRTYGAGIHYVYAWLVNNWQVLEGPPAPPVVPKVELTINGVVFERPKEVTIRAELNAAGEGFVVLDRNDPQCTAANLVRGSICTVTIPEIDPDLPVFAFLLEDGDWDLISSDEEGGEELRFSGPGVLWLLNRAVIAPEEYETGTGYPKPKKGVWVFADGVTEGHILNKLMREAESVSRPDQPLPGVTDDFTSVLDSDGVAWGDEVLDGKWRVPIGASLYDEVLRLVAAGLLQVEMDPALVLHAWRSIGTDRTGDFGAGVVRFEKGVNIADELVRSQAGRDFASHAFVRYGEESGEYTWTAKSGTWPYVQETFVEANTSAETTAKRIARGQMGWREAAQDAPAFAHVVPWPGEGNDEDAGIYLPGPRWTANGLYWVGDLVTLHTGTADTDYQEATKRVYAVTLSMDETGYLATPKVELEAPYTHPSLERARTVVSVPNTGGGTSGGTSGGGLDLSGYQREAEKGAADGYASLDSGALVPEDELGTGGTGSVYDTLHGNRVWARPLEAMRTISPAQLTADTDNWNPTGLSTAEVIRVSTDASRNLTGIVAPSNPAMLVLENIGSQDLVLKHDATSTAANRFYLPGGTVLTLTPGVNVWLAYDATSSRWRAVGGTGSGTGSGTAVAVREAGGATLEAALDDLDFGHGLDVTAAGAGNVTVDVDEAEFTYGTAGDIAAEAIGSTASGGAIGKPADAGHRHPMPTAAAPSGGYGAATAGAAATLLRSDARFPAPTAAQITVADVAGNFGTDDVESALADLAAGTITSSIPPAVRAGALLNASISLR